MAAHPSTFHPLRLHRSLAPLPFRDRASLGPDGRRRRPRPEAAPRIVLSRRSRGHSSAASPSEGFEPSRRKDRSGAPIGSPAHRSSASAIDFLTLCHRLKVLHGTRAVSALISFALATSKNLSVKQLGSLSHFVAIDQCPQLLERELIAKMRSILCQLLLVSDYR